MMIASKEHAPVTVAQKFLSISVSYDEKDTMPLERSAIVLKSVDISGADQKVRFSFKCPRGIDFFSCTRLQADILRYTSEFRGPGTLLSLPDYFYRSGDLILEKLRLFGATREGNQITLNLRWSHLTGDVFTILGTVPALRTPKQLPHSKLALEVLHCIVNPIFEISDVLVNMPADYDEADMRRAMSEIVSRRSDMESYSELLKFYLRNFSYEDGLASEDQSLEEQTAKYLC